MQSMLTFKNMTSKISQCIENYEKFPTHEYGY
jgi:hypothetical protein